MKIPLAIPTFGKEEILEALDSMLSANVVMGEKVKTFERMFAKYVGRDYGVMVNSGSSANLLAFSTLLNPLVQNRMNTGDEVIAPALTWSTTISPIFQSGLIPKLVDVDLETLTVEPETIEDAISENTEAIMPVHLMGNPCNMKEISEIARDKDLWLIEDACEAPGAEYLGRKVGSYGDISTFSFFLSHHITTIEGGMLLTSEPRIASIARSLRAHGWIREMDNETKEEITATNPLIDPKFLFATSGYNFRPTEIQASFGIRQLPKLEQFIQTRERNGEYLLSRLKQFSDEFILPSLDHGSRKVWFGFPIIVRDSVCTRGEITSFLESKSIETRPIMAGNITEHPYIRNYKYRIHGTLDNSRKIMRDGFYFATHHGVTKEECNYIISCFEEFFSRR